MRTNLEITVVAQGSTYEFTGRKAVELKYWLDSPNRPLVFTRGSAGDDFMYHPLGLEPHMITVNCVEVCQQAY